MRSINWVGELLVVQIVGRDAFVEQPGIAERFSPSSLALSPEREPFPSPRKHPAVAAYSADGDA
jgi:hypothetical protein